MTDKKLVAFTFDDTPAFKDLDDNPTTTILNVLNQFDGKATFFIVGKSIRKNGRKLVDEILKQGSEIANHSDTHAKPTEISKEELKNEILTLQETVKNEFGIDMKYYRPPYLCVNPTVYSITSELKLPVIGGSENDAYLSDWDNKTPPEHIKEHCLNNVYPGQIILMHSYSLGTQAAFQEICETLYKDGYKFVTLTELFEAYGIEELPCNCIIADALISK